MYILALLSTAMYRAAAPRCAIHARRGAALRARARAGARRPRAAAAQKHTQHSAHSSFEALNQKTCR
jgi:hypothetical protein